MNYVWLLAVFGVILYILIMRARMERIENVEVDKVKITITGTRGLLCFKKNFEKCIKLNQIAKIEKVLEGKNHEMFTCIRLYGKITEVFGKRIDELDEDVLNNEVIQQEIRKNSFLGVISGRTQEELNDFYTKLLTYIDRDKVEVVEQLM